MPSKSLTVHDKNAQEATNKIKFLYDSLENADDKADITVYRSNEYVQNESICKK